MKRLLYFSFLIAHFSFSVSAFGTTRPWTFWYWMYGAVSEQGIRADLQAMKDVGLGGCYLMPIRGAVERPEYEGKADALTPNFWRMAVGTIILPCPSPSTTLTTTRTSPSMRYLFLPPTFPTRHMSLQPPFPTVFRRVSSLTPLKSPSTPRASIVLTSLAGYNMNSTSLR